MHIAYYMRFSLEGDGPDRVGGLPSHLPMEMPVSRTGEQLGFLAQFYCDAERLNVKNALCIQIYQDFDERYPEPIAVIVRPDAIRNTSGIGRRKPIAPHNVYWDRREDPDEVSRWDDEVGDSKAAGLPYYDDAVFHGERMLLQITELPMGFNFGGYAAIVVQNDEGHVLARLG